MCFFFFSSRRRHTRLTCDWSSDVCSSDLEVEQVPARVGDHVLLGHRQQRVDLGQVAEHALGAQLLHDRGEDRKSTRLNSSHMSISYAVFCLKKKKKKTKL